MVAGETIDDGLAKQLTGLSLDMFDAEAVFGQAYYEELDDQECENMYKNAIEQQTDMQLTKSSLAMLHKNLLDTFPRLVNFSQGVSIHS